MAFCYFHSQLALRAKTSLLVVCQQLKVSMQNIERFQEYSGYHFFRK